MPKELMVQGLQSFFDNVGKDEQQIIELTMHVI